MNSPNYLKEITDLALTWLQPKDLLNIKKWLKNRDFLSIYEIVKAELILINKPDYPCNSEEDLIHINNTNANLLCLQSILESYMVLNGYDIMDSEENDETDFEDIISLNNNYIYEKY